MRMVVAIIVVLCAYVGYDLQSDYEPYVPESIVSEELQVWDAKPVSSSKTVSCSDFASQYQAQLFMEAYPLTRPMFDQDGNGYACTDVDYVSECYPSCEYVQLQLMTPEERVAIGAVEYMPPYFDRG
jgi:hypothetical protein